MWDFVKNEIVDTPEAVPERYRGLYAEDKASGKWKVRDDVKDLASDYTGVVAKLNDAGKRKKADNDKDAARRITIDGIVEMLGDFGIETVEDIAELPVALRNTLTDLTEKVKGGKEHTINLDKLKQKFQKELQDAKAGWESERGAMEGSLYEYMVKGEATSALAAAGAIKPELLMPHVQSATKVVKLENGKYGVRVKDAEGEIRTNGAGEPMSVSEYVKDLKTQYPEAFKSEAKKGSDHKQNDGRKATKIIEHSARENMSATDKIQAGLARMGRG